MNRAEKNKVRGKQKAAPVPVGKPATAMGIQNFDGRANTAAGAFETQAVRGTSPEGQQVQWKGIVK